MFATQPLSLMDNAQATNVTCCSFPWQKMDHSVRMKLHIETSEFPISKSWCLSICPTL